MHHPNFPDTDVPIACLFIHLQHGYTVDQFLQDFPGVSEEWVEQVLDLAITIFKAPTMDRVFENGDE